MEKTSPTTNLIRWYNTYAFTVDPKLSKKYWSAVQDLLEMYNRTGHGDTYPISLPLFISTLQGVGAKVVKGKINQKFGLC